MRPTPIILPALLLALSGDPTIPAQPDSGPGSATYAHADWRRTVLGEGGEKVWVLEPQAPAPESAPVVVFLHGWGATSPQWYGGWIEHLLGRGCLVLFPTYQQSLFTPAERFTPNTAEAVRTALAWLEEEGADRVRPDRTRVAVVGHSVGGLLAASFAATAAAQGLPRPGAVMCVQPGISRRPGDAQGVPLEDLSGIAAGTLLLALAGDRDHVVGTLDARRIVRDAAAVEDADKAYVLFPSQDDGPRRLLADHRDPNSPPTDPSDERWTDPNRKRRSGAASPGGMDFESVDIRTNAHDGFGYWRLLDALCAAAWEEGADRELCLGEGESMRSLGVWSDGVPVTPLVVD